MALTFVQFGNHMKKLSAYGFALAMFILEESLGSVQVDSLGRHVLQSIQEYRRLVRSNMQRVQEMKSRYGGLTDAKRTLTSLMTAKTWKEVYNVFDMIEHNFHVVEQDGVEHKQLIDARDEIYLFLEDIVSKTMENANDFDDIVPLAPKIISAIRNKRRLRLTHELLDEFSESKVQDMEAFFTQVTNLFSEIQLSELKLVT